MAQQKIHSSQLNLGTAEVENYLGYSPVNKNGDTMSGNLELSSNLVLPKSTNLGIKVDNASPSWGWRDLVGQVQVRGSGAQDPSWVVYNGVIYQYQFTLLDEVTILYHVPHDYVAGTDLFMHAHWSLNGAGVSQNCTWKFDVTYAKGFNQSAFVTPITTTVLQASSTTQYQHMIAEAQITGSGLLNASTIEVDGIIIARISLSANSGTGTGTSRPFLHTADIHYQSTNMATKAKAPNFYV